MYLLRAKNIFDIAKSFISAKVFKQKCPLAISWMVTRKCNLRCLYCGGGVEEEELNTSDILLLIKELRKNGARFISFTGGEPLLRDDIGEIIDFAAKNSIFVKMNTNGYFLKDRIADLKKLDIIQLSVDGTKEINDFVRGDGVFDRAMVGLESALSENKKIHINLVISKYNLAFLEKTLIDICLRYNIRIYFQPYRIQVLQKSKENAIFPEQDEYKRVIFQLIGFKKSKKYGKFILNSLVGLNHLCKCPVKTAVPCYAGILSFRLDNKGWLYPCDEIVNDGVNIIGHNVKDILPKIKYSPCKECWCANKIEFNFIVALNLNAISNIFI